MSDAKIPDWRPGAIFWKPLIDGREITVYPTIMGGARLCLGKLADEGMEKSWQYEGIQECLYEARRFDGEGDPKGWVKFTGPGGHVRRHGEPEEGDLFNLEKGDEVHCWSIMGEPTSTAVYSVTREIVNGTILKIEGRIDLDAPESEYGVVRVLSKKVLRRDEQGNVHEEKVK